MHHYKNHSEEYVFYTNVLFRLDFFKAFTHNHRGHHELITTRCHEYGKSFSK